VSVGEEIGVKEKMKKNVQVVSALELVVAVESALDGTEQRKRHRKIVSLRSVKISTCRFRNE